MTSEQSPLAPYRLSSDAVISALGSNGQNGLDGDEADQRLERDGPNELSASRPVPGWRKLLAQFSDTLVILLLLAAAISSALWLIERDSPLPYEAIAILAIVLFNAAMGYIQQARAEQAVAELQQMSAAQARVIRDGQQQSIPAARLVAGDIILVEEGDTIPADSRLIQSVSLQTSEATLTGESLPESKDPETIIDDAPIGDRQNMIFSGTTVTYGRGTAIVTATGMQSQIGQIAGMLEQAPPETTPLQQDLARVGRMLGLVVIMIAVVIILTIILVDHVTGFSALFDVLILGVALAVAAVPEGLPAIVTAVLALGVQRMARRNAIVRHLAAVETLGAANVIASDKTGTLTRNEMTVKAIVTASGRVTLGGTGYEPAGEVSVHTTLPSSGSVAVSEPLRMELERALTVGDRATNAVLQEDDGQWTVQGDPTEGALLVAARKIGLTEAILDARYERVGEVPFSSERKMMSTLHTDRQHKGHIQVFTKGAPDVLLGRCDRERLGDTSRPLTEERRSEILQANEQLAGEALRTLGVAARYLPEDGFEADNIDDDLEQDLIFVGLIGMIDPPREEAKQAVAQARSAGIRPVMITGDHPVTAAVIGAELGICTDGRAITGAEIDGMTDEALYQTVQDVSVYARVNPEHKLRIVKALQNDKNIVAMTGDGVNDAPALRTADIGIAMGINGTDVSRKASDIILADDNFATIVAAVEEGRTIFANIRKFLRYLLSSNIGEVLTMFFGVLLADVIGLTANGAGLALPLLATQILWINMVSDGAPALALGLDPGDGAAMTKPPRPRGEGILTRDMWAGIVFVGIITATGTLLVLDASMPGGLIAGTGSLAYGQTMAFTTLVLFSMFTVFISRSDEQSAFSGLFSNLWLWAAVGGSLLLQMAVVYLPFLQKPFSTVSLSLEDWLFCAAVASSVLWLRELSKMVIRLQEKESGPTAAGSR
ncbi:cation-translocating P-type ATPase [Marinobacter sp. 1_MG-2023]|uniref:cation-translocating P-type ATPase n=1 Tax=Marinobacter sp. 1_MG-2023 TaxID=3062627 RepID=UPI0026E46D29|nr:cation-translocating P-type ATPase [Marinobacter sp. 1_MG-2023]MDO6822160.1 cation-translocating P-type ATPase [Marinobacter sp. 1_MG-2023]